MFGNMLGSLVEHGRIETTERKAHELRSIAEKAISRAKSLGEVLSLPQDQMDPGQKARYIHAIRMVRRTLKDRALTQKLFVDWAPRYIERPGGYTRIFKLGNRRGDGAAMAKIEFVPAELPASAAGGDTSKATAEQPV